MNTRQALNFVAGLLSGAVAGAAVALLLAPQSGADLKQAIVDQVNELRELGRKAYQERHQALESQYKEAIRIPIPLDQGEGA